MSYPGRRMSGAVCVDGGGGTYVLVDVPIPKRSMPANTKKSQLRSKRRMSLGHTDWGDVWRTCR